MKKTLTITFVGFLLVGCTSKLESDFINGCKSTGGSSAYCSCTYEKMEDRLKAAEKNPNLMFGSEFKNAYAKAIEACVR